MDPNVGRIALAVYAVLLGVGGVMGYLKANSRPSLIAGVGSAIVALIALGLAMTSGTERTGFIVGLCLAVALVWVFSARYVKTRKLMPSGLLATVSLAMVVLLGALIYSM